jgi:hypothetical protein
MSEMLRKAGSIGAAILAGTLALAPVAKAANAPIGDWDTASSSERAQAMATHRSRPYPSTGFRVRGTGGYRIFVTGYPKGTVAHHDVVSLVAEADGALAGYTVRGEVTSKRIKADVGEFGSIDMRFHPRKGHGHFTPTCSSSRYKVKRGRWRGEIDFSGESGYTTVSAKRAKPTWLSEPTGCSSVDTGSGVRGVWLDNISGQTFFDAYQNGGPGTRTQFDATKFEGSSGGVDIVRQVWTDGSPDAFTYNKRLTKASATPPAPFHGSVSFTRSPHSRKGTLEGDLTATFPGTGPVGLVGSKNDASIQHARVTIVR